MELVYSGIYYIILKKEDANAEIKVNLGLRSAEFAMAIVRK